MSLHFVYIIYPIVSVLPYIFALIYSGVMMQQLKQPGMECMGYDKEGEPVDATAKYLIMAKLCFSTSFIILVTSIILFVLNCLVQNTRAEVIYLIIKLIFDPIVSLSNLVVIPVTIFAQWSAPCHKI